MVLMILAVIWSLYGFSWWRSRDDSSPTRSISSFEQHLAHLGRTMDDRPRTTVPAGATTTIAGSLRPTSGAAVARRRRRDVLLALAGASASTLLLAVAAGGSFVALHLLADLLLAGYVALLVRVRRLAEERRSKVVVLPTAPADEPLLLTRSGS